MKAKQLFVHNDAGRLTGCGAYACGGCGKIYAIGLSSSPHSDAHRCCRQHAGVLPPKGLAIGEALLKEEAKNKQLREALEVIQKGVDHEMGQPGARLFYEALAWAAAIATKALAETETTDYIKGKTEGKTTCAGEAKRPADDGNL